MRALGLLTIGFTLLLASCVSRSNVVDDLTKNPLYAEVLADGSIDFLVAMTVKGIRDPHVRRAHERALAQTQRLQQWAHEEEKEGEGGYFISDDYVVDGKVLLLPSALHLGFDFMAEAAPGLRLALSTVLLPTTYEEFVAGEERDIGNLQSIIGPQSYRLDPPVEKNRYATVVLYSPELKVVLGFAQI
jgi:hypothetical protein